MEFDDLEVFGIEAEYIRINQSDFLKNSLDNTIEDWIINKTEDKDKPIVELGKRDRKQNVLMNIGH